MKPYKFGSAAFIGRPNAGKSTILNRLIGQKIAAEADKAQTTRRRINGILTTDEAQIVFLDTPGMHKPLDKLGEVLVKEAVNALNDADAVLFTADVSNPAGRGDKWTSENVMKNFKGQIILVLNKSDLIADKALLEKNISSYKSLFSSDLPCVLVSAKTGRNFDILIKTIAAVLPFGDKVYDDDEITDETMRDIARELIREKIMLNTREEVPHSTAVLIEKYEELENIDKIKAQIIVEHDTQKGILIGKNGSMLKKIGAEARKDIEETLGKKVFLELQVKVIKNWRKRTKDIEKMF